MFTATTWGSIGTLSVQLSHRSSSPNPKPARSPSTATIILIDGWSLYDTREEMSHSLVSPWSGFSASSSPVAASRTETVPDWPTGRVAV